MQSMLRRFGRDLGLGHVPGRSAELIVATAADACTELVLTVASPRSGRKVVPEAMADIRSTSSASDAFSAEGQAAPSRRHGVPPPSVKLGGRLASAVIGRQISATEAPGYAGSRPCVRPQQFIQPGYLGKRPGRRPTHLRDPARGGISWDGLSRSSHRSAMASCRSFTGRGSASDQRAPSEGRRSR